MKAPCVPAVIVVVVVVVIIDIIQKLARGIKIAAQLHTAETCTDIWTVSGYSHSRYTSCWHSRLTLENAAWNTCRGLSFQLSVA